jgi:tRNA 2-thiouridine synthesizing protein A
MEEHSSPQPAASPPVELDVRGKLCPLPVLLAERRLATLPAGARLAVTGDDPGMLEDFPAWCAGTGHRLVDLARGEAGVIRCVIEKRPA